MWYALEQDSYVILESGILPTEYTTSVTLEDGQNYKFKVQARNAVGYSLDSQEVIIRAARVPDIPTGVVTTSDLDNV